MDIFPKNN